MQCVQLELKTAKMECNNTNGRIDQALEILSEHVEVSNASFCGANLEQKEEEEKKLNN